MVGVGLGAFRSSGLAAPRRDRRPFALSSGSERVGVALVFAVGWLLLVGYALHALLTIGGHGADALFDKWFNDAIVIVAAGLCIWRGVRVREERLAWLLLSLGMASWVAGNIWYSVFLIDLNPFPIPSIADGLWLGLYPPIYFALALLIGARVRNFRPALWLDAIIVAVSAAALSSAVVLQAVLGSTHRLPLSAALTDLAYPVGDMILLAFVFASFALAAWRPERRWGYLGAGLLAFMVTDSLFLVKTADGTYAVGTIIDAGWLLAAMLVAVAAWQPPARRDPVTFEGTRVLVVPTIFGCASLGLLIWDHFERVNDLALLLASAASLLVVARLILTFAEKAQMLARSRADATSDSLTRLGNRRKLLDDLATSVRSATSAEPLLVVLLDLDGFKSYNDLYGHPAGDALLTRIAARLEAAVGPTGSAYRMGGDEFCVLLHGGAEDAAAAAQRLAEAVSESGSGWSIRASAGHALAPTEASAEAEILRLADARMYATKQRRLPASNRVLGDVLERLTEARDGGLNAHSRAVAGLAERLAAELDLPPEECDQIRLAAQLHDIGKLALPDSIASQPRLDEDDWQLVRQHTLVGAKVLSGTTALAEVALLVRASHERWDGTGYPDSLGGEEIPLGARIIFCCDAYDTMVRGRPYQPEISPGDALAELRRCAGTQFDPGVVEAFANMLAAREQLQLAS